MGFMNVASASELKPGDMKGVEVGGKEIALINLDGQICAIGNRCTHMSCLLSDGSLMADGVHCACHGSVFDPRTGGVVKGPARNPEPVYAIKIEGDQIQVDV